MFSRNKVMLNDFSLQPLECYDFFHYSGLRVSCLHSNKFSIKVKIHLFVLFRDIFTGLRGPPKGLLLFGPPGTGKTLIGN